MLLEDVDTVITRGRRRRYCGFTQWARTLDDADYEMAVALVDDRAYNCRELARYFQTKGATFNDQVVNRHRNGRCCRALPSPQTQRDHEG